MRPRTLRRTILAIAAIALAACSPDTVTRTEWERMSGEDRVLYVRSLVGAEKVKDAKGGGGRDYAREAEEYVTRIDSAYAGGDQRPAHQIFAELSH